MSCNRRPRRIGIVGGHGAGDGRGFWPEVFLINLALLIYDERHYAGIAPFGRPCDQSKTGDHVAINDVIVFAAWRMAALAREDLEIIPMIRRLRVLLGHHPGVTMIAFRLRLGNERAERA